MPDDINNQIPSEVQELREKLDNILDDIPGDDAIIIVKHKDLDSTLISYRGHFYDVATLIKSVLAGFREQIARDVG